MREQSSQSMNTKLSKTHFRGGETRVMKKRLSSLLVFALVLTMILPAFAFAADEELTTLDKFNALKEAKILDGVNAAGDAGLDQSLTRSELAKVLVLLSGNTASAGNGGFWDVPATHWVATQGWVVPVTNAKLMEGTGVGQFGPDQKLTFAEIAKVTVTALGLDVDSTATVEGVQTWAAPFVKVALEAGLISEQEDYHAIATRADLVEATFVVYLNNQKAVINVEGIVEITPTTVTVTLDKEPENDLNASYFKVAGNTVTSAVKGSYDTLYTLTLGSSLDGKKGTLTVNGTSAAYDFTQLKINSVNVKNLRQLDVVFNKPVDKGQAFTDLLFISLAEEVEGSIHTNSITNINPDFKATLSKDQKTVTLAAENGDLLFDLGLSLNQRFEIDALNIVDADGKYGDASAAFTVLNDTVRPVASLDEDEVVLNAGTVDLTIVFSEPVKERSASKKYEIYVDGNLLDLAADVTFTDVVTNDTVAKHSAITIEGLASEKGTHKIALVGIEDLNGNLLSNNGKDLTFKVVDPAESTPTSRLTVVKLDQVADNAFLVEFNRKMTAAEKTATDEITIKEGAFNAGTGKFEDIVVTLVDTDNFVDVPKNATTGKNEYTYAIVIVDATKYDAVGELSYRGANAITKRIFLPKTTDGLDRDYNGSLTFKKDTNAPVVATDGISHVGTTIRIKMTDAPFTNDQGNGQIELSDKNVLVKYVDENGVTFVEEIDNADIALLAKNGTATANKGVGEQGYGIALTITDPDMLNAKEDALVRGGVYTIELVDGIVKDAEEVYTNAGLTGDFLIVDGAHPFVKKTLTYTVGGTTAAGNVPQTTRGLIFTGFEVNELVGAGGTYFVDDVAAQQATGIEIKDNQIVVVFIGEEVDAKTITNKNNYILNGKLLPAGTVIEFREANITGSTATPVLKHKFALITLPNDSVQYSGNYDFSVKDVANKDGKKMLPVNAIVKLKDNTAPKVTKVETSGTKEVIVTFSEYVELSASATPEQLAENFIVVVGGKEYQLEDVYMLTTPNNKVVIRVAGNFALNATASVKLKLNDDGDMFVTDAAGNKAK